ncbi:MAG TPA: hypothetical protein VFP89_15515 [Propionibacteriaceae bacterium]|nr:hypothetical protein [Propionibacteriaceae bacterium]
MRTRNIPSVLMRSLSIINCTPGTAMVVSLRCAQARGELPFGLDLPVELGEVAVLVEVLDRDLLA